MATKIEWCEETWNFLGGCTPISEGCEHCCAACQAAGRLKNHSLYEGLTKNGKWTGEIRLCTDIGREDILEKPLHWHNARTIFPCFMGDLFHEAVRFEFIDEIFGMTFAASWHTYLFLTKRIVRAAEYFNSLNREASLTMLKQNWLGVTAENQKRADERIPILLQMPAAKRFVSIEPMLGPVDLMHLNIGMKNAWQMAIGGKYGTMLDWVIVGGESGPKRRECKLEWIENIVDQGKAAGVPVFVKQIHLDGKLIKDFKQFPKLIRVREYPDGQ